MRFATCSHLCAATTPVWPHTAMLDSDADHSKHEHELVLPLVIDRLCHDLGLAQLCLTDAALWHSPLPRCMSHNTHISILEVYGLAAPR